MRGIARYVVEELLEEEPEGERSRISGSSFSLEASVSIPKLFYEGSYTLQGRCLLRPVDWSGKFNMSLGESAASIGNVTDTWKLTADVVKKGKENYLDLQDLVFSPEVSAFSTYATGLFGELKEVGQFALLMVNKHWQLFFDEMWTLAEPRAVKTGSRAVRRVLFQTPVDAPSSV
ncbi:uncharacterized protein LOC134530017 [Bacillus rossius redtenbacheri]|uniref:uncharacterized protein LOC134530017 n=1 Tax=Bacillus rossius redtenbacheri TaxID=93214 RepID=UPI002FDDC985